MPGAFQPDSVANNEIPDTSGLPYN